VEYVSPGPRLYLKRTHGLEKLVLFIPGVLIQHDFFSNMSCC
jgi:hypothetical protein